MCINVEGMDSFGGEVLEGAVGRAVDRSPNNWSIVSLWGFYLLYSAESWRAVSGSLEGLVHRARSASICGLAKLKGEASV